MITELRTMGKPLKKRGVTEINIIPDIRSFYTLDRGIYYDTIGTGLKRTSNVALSPVGMTGWHWACLAYGTLRGWGWGSLAPFGMQWTGGSYGS